MGGTITLTPNATVTPPTSGWNAVGGTFAVVLGDSNDSTYIQDTVTGSSATYLREKFSNPGLPAGAAIKYITAQIRSSQATGNKKLRAFLYAKHPITGGIYRTPDGLWTPSAAIGNVNLPAGGAVPLPDSQVTLDNLWIDLFLDGGGAATEDHRIYKIFGTAYYVDSPTAAGLSLNPSNANNLTTRPPITWAFTSADGFTQYEYRVALWAQTDINLFPGGQAAFEANYTNIFDRQDTILPSKETNFTGTDAQVHSPIWNTKVDGVPSWITGTDDTATPDVDLGATGTYVYYVQVSALHAGQRLFAPTYGKLSFTMAITLPAQPTAITATWQRDFQFQTKIDVTVAAESLGSWTGRRVIVERHIVGTAATEWRTIPKGTVEVGAGAGTWTVYDTLPPVNRNVEYRARSVFYNSTLGYEASGTRRTSSAQVTDFNAFVLRDPLTVGSAMVLKWLGDFEGTEDAVQGRFRPLASDYPVIISDAVLGQSWNAQVLIRNTADELAFTTLRRLQTPLILQTDMDDRWWWVRIGDQVTRTTYRQADRKTATKRSQLWSFQLIEVQAIPGQPQIYF